MSKEFVKITFPLFGSDFKLFEKVVNQGIDAHLEAFTKSKFNERDGRVVCQFHVSELPLLVRRLEEEGSESAMSWADDIRELEEYPKTSKNPRGKAKKFTDEDLYQWLEDHRIMWGRKSDGTIWVRTHGYKTHGDDGHYGVEKIMMQAGYWMADEEFDRMVGQTVGLYKKRSQSKNPGENWRVRPADQKIMWGDEVEDRGNIKKPRNDTYATEGALRYVVHKKVAARLGAGSADNVEAFEDTTHIYVLSMNSGLNYAGLQTFKKTDKGPVMDGEVFLQSDTDFNSLMEIDTEAEDYDPSYDDGFSKFYELEPKEQIGLLLGYIS